MRTLDETSIRRALRSGTLGHLGLARDGDAYVIPLYYGYDGKNLYFHGTHGLKSEFADHTRRACFCVDFIASEDEWTSVLVYGPVAKVTEDHDRLAAMDALMERPNPPAWGGTATGEPGHADQPEEYFMLTIEEATGRASYRDSTILEEAVERQGA